MVRADTSEYSFPLPGQRCFFGWLLSQLEEEQQSLIARSARIDFGTNYPLFRSNDERPLLFSVVRCLPDREDVSIPHQTSGQASNKAQGRKPRDAARRSGRAMRYGDLTGASSFRSIEVGDRASWIGMVGSVRSNWTGRRVLLWRIMARESDRGLVLASARISCRCWRCTADGHAASNDWCFEPPRRTVLGRSAAKRGHSRRFRGFRLDGDYCKPPADPAADLDASAQIARFFQCSPKSLKLSAGDVCGLDSRRFAGLEREDAV